MASLIRFSIGGRQEWLDRIIGNLVIEPSTYTMPDGTSISPGGVSGSGGLTLSAVSLATTSTDGITLTNATAATGTATVQISPRLRLRGTAWDTAASQTVDFFIENLPATAATPTGTFKVGYSLNGAAATYPLTLTNTGTLTVLSAFTAANSVTCGAAANFIFSSRALMNSPVNGHLAIANQAETTGVRLKVDALPTINSGSGTGVAVTAGSTAMAGSLNVGTGAPGTVIVIDFNGAAFPSAPFPIALNTTTGALLKATASTTQLTITGNATFNASDVIAWHCIGARA